ARPRPPARDRRNTLRVRAHRRLARARNRRVRATLGAPAARGLRRPPPGRGRRRAAVREPGTTPTQAGETRAAEGAVPNATELSAAACSTAIARTTRACEIGVLAPPVGPALESDVDGDDPGPLGSRRPLARSLARRAQPLPPRRRARARHLARASRALPRGARPDRDRAVLVGAVAPAPDPPPSFRRPSSPPPCDR